MENYDGIVLLMSLLSHSSHRRIIKSFSKIGIRIPINGSRITSISALHHGEKNLVFEVQWQHSQQVRYGMAFIPDTTWRLSQQASSKHVGNVHLSIYSIKIDYRRHLRPFFLDADLITPTKYKKYYDIISWLVIMSTYNYVVQPFIILSIWDSLRLWGRLKVLFPMCCFIELFSFTFTLELQCLFYFFIAMVGNGLIPSWREKCVDGIVCQNIMLHQIGSRVEVQAEESIWFLPCQIQWRSWKADSWQFEIECMSW